VISNKLVLSKSVRAGLLAHARDGDVNSEELTEVCGILAGSRTPLETPSRVTEYYPISNIAATPRVAYELDPAETLGRIDALEAAGEQLVGFYHSHPDSPASPSDTDRAQAHWPGYLYLIVSAQTTEIAGWWWTGDRFEPADLDVIADSG